MRIKNIYIKSFPCLLIGLILMIASCKRTEFQNNEFNKPSGADVKIVATPKASNANIIDFKNASGGFKAVWDFGNGKNAVGDAVTGSYAEAGTYTVKLTIFTNDGFASSTQQVTIAQTKPEMLRGTEYDALTGTVDDKPNVDGKTWVIEKYTLGHIGLGTFAPSPSFQYRAKPNELVNKGIYDDEVTFNLYDFKYTYTNNGDTYANKDNAKDLGVVGATSDVKVSYTAPTNLTWKLVTEDGKKYITLTNNGFIAYYSGSSKYEILSINKDQMYLRTTNRANPSQAVYLRLSRKGFTPVVVEKILKAANLIDAFDSTGNVNWVAEKINFANNYDNPSVLGINPSKKVGYYERKAGEEFKNGYLQRTVNYRFDLSKKNKIRLKVFFLGENNYSLVNPKVSVRLQNSSLEEYAVETQREISHVVTQYDKWIQLEFDFSAFAADKIYDKIVIQLGGDGHPYRGIFYIDDFEFE